MQRYKLFCLIIKEYISWWIHTINKALTLSWRRSLSYRSKSIDLLFKLMDWFLYDKDIRHESVKMLFTHHTPKICSYMSWSRISFIFVFFYQGFFSRISWFTGQQGNGEAISLTSLYHFHLLYRHLDISQIIAAESSLLRIVGSRTHTSNLWFPIGSH